MDPVLLVLNSDFAFNDNRGEPVEVISTEGNNAVMVEIVNRCGLDVELTITASNSVSVSRANALDEQLPRITLDALLNATARCQGRLSCIPANISTSSQCAYWAMPMRAALTSTLSGAPALTAMATAPFRIR